MRKLPTFKDVDKEIIDGFFNFMVLKGKKDNTIYGDMWKLAAFVRFFEMENNSEGKSIQDITKTDVEKFFVYRRKAKKNDGTNFSEATIRNNFILLRTFFKWYYKEYKKGDWKFLFDNIDVKKPSNKLSAEKVLKEHDVHSLLRGCFKQRDRAIIMLLWDSAARVSELTGLNIEHFERAKHGGKIHVDGKTGKRTIRLFSSVPDLNVWINQHPDRNNPNAPLFITERKYDGEYRRLDRHTISNMLKGVTKRTGCKKPTNPHAFRHGRLTHLAEKGFNEMELREFAGWSGTSEMPDVYIHISRDHVDKKLLKLHGIIEEEPEEIKTGKLEPKECPACHHINPHDAKYCSMCPMVLDELEVLRADEIEEKAMDLMDIVAQIPDAMKVFAEIGKKMNDQ